MSDLSRVEQLLRNALGEDIYEVTPQSRVEALLVELNEMIEGMGGSVSPEDIATAVAAYLDEHPINPTNIQVDTSLTIAGAAADAKKTGDEIGDLKEDLNAITDAIIQPVAGANKLNPDTMTAGYRVANDGTITESSAITVSDYIEVPNGVTYALGCARYNPSNPNSWSFSYGRMAFYDASKVFISPWYNSTLSAVQIPTGAKYVRVDFPIAYSNMYMGFSNGASLPTYEEYGVTYENIALVRVEEVEEEVGSLDERVSVLVVNNANLMPTLKLPSEYNLVVGDTFELFYKGIIDAMEYSLYNIEITCSIGSPFTRKFVCTPTTAGTYPLRIILKDYADKILDQKTVNLVVSAKATSPSAQKNILCVGDSLTTSGAWVYELHRRLTASDGTPVGDGLSNINFIGTRRVNNVGYEGYGGWKIANYNTENLNDNAKVITCTHDKTEVADQHSVYKDANNATWKLETIESGQIKIICVSGDYKSFPTTGTLTWVSSGTNHSDIVYTASTNAAGNPFWNATTGKVDFALYAQNQGVTSIDYVYVLIGWNGVSSNMDTNRQNTLSDMQTFIDNVHADFPNAKIVLMGLQIPARDGLGTNYGAHTVPYSNYRYLTQYVFNLDEWYEAIADDNENVYHFNMAGQFDTEYNMPVVSVDVNIRNSTKENQQSNGVHPATNGYMQIADAAYRDITARL